MRRHAAILAAAVCLTAASASFGCTFDVAVSTALTLDVRVDCAGTAAGRLRALDDATDALVADITDVQGHPLTRDRDGWALPDGGPRTARYRLDLNALADAQRGNRSAIAVGGSVLAELSTWLLLPEPLPEDATLRLVVHTAPDVGFASALATRDGALTLPARSLRAGGYAVFGRFAETTLAPPAPGALAVDADAARRGAKAAVRLVTFDRMLDLSAAEIAAWVADTAGAVARFWNGFPVDRLLLVVVPQAGRAGIPYGRVIAGGGATLMIQVGEHATRSTLYDDWVLIHEFVHLGSPFVARSPWMTEGFATYFEPIIRLRAGRRSRESLWAEFSRDMPRGEYAVQSEGLAYTRRGMYWGGAILMLLADIEMRERSAGRRGLEDCLRAVLAGGGDATRIVSAPWMIDACDRADGGDVMQRLTKRYAWSHDSVDLDAVWRRLGVVRSGAEVRLDDNAPLAWLRRTIETGRPGSG